MAYDRYPDDDRRDGAFDDRLDRDRERPRGRGFFRGGRDDRGPSRYDGDRDGRRDSPRIARDDDHRARRGVPYDETSDLIASSKVEGTPVYGRDDRRLGTVKALMIDKVRGEVRYAVLSHATGFLGLDEEVVPVRWEELRYDERRGGYRVDFTSEDVAFTIENRSRTRTEARNLDREGRIRR
ncbi:sporulation protein YlmC with PRC-barrel domain [Sphingomonas kaistensis]|uniref:Sporulation protein YlmC with PRC-barrel domain n=1 Tax=Sphingomonas kaistensis TaxID=298708 RepID=A0A7X5Y8U5_9SPHN|nr:PRC-barrel domain-containing protein [Sphingomonas kaistensis]NJC06692.1 sporulation protein YlmC with PRC-barrel domain [Sphingomonas kaistensis]